MHANEPTFLTKGLRPAAWTLLKDFGNFFGILVFYGGCWLLGSLAFMLDNMFATRLFERLIRLVERLDGGT